MVVLLTNCNLGRDSRLSDRPQPEKKDVSVVEGIGDLLHSAAHTVVQAPIDGVSQMAGAKGPQIIPQVESSNYYTTAGNIIGSVAQFVVASKVMRKGLSTAGVVPAGAPLSVLEMSSTGAPRRTT